jgi:hypothetical protein
MAGLGTRIGAPLLAVAIAAGVSAAFVARASEHPRVEPSAAAGCAACHMSEYRNASHHVGERPTTCGTCHAQSSWHEKIFDHPFALTGAHARISCFKCHTGDPAAFHGTPNACIGCHRAEYEGAPHHVGHFSMTCTDCHGFAAWKPILENAIFPPEPPEPVPTTTATTTPTATTTATTSATTSATTPKPKPRPPKPPKPQPSTAPTTTKPDVVTKPSIHEHEE